MSKLHGIERIKLAWDEIYSEAPDGTTYNINSETVRGELQFNWLEAVYPEDSTTASGFPKVVTVELESNSMYPTKAQLRALAERDATRREAERQGLL